MFSTEVGSDHGHLLCLTEVQWLFWDKTRGGAVKFITLLVLMNLWYGHSNYPSLQTRKLRWGEVISNSTTVPHPSQWLSWDLSPGNLAEEPMPPATNSCDSVSVNVYRMNEKQMNEWMNEKMNRKNTMATIVTMMGKKTSMRGSA